MKTAPLSVELSCVDHRKELVCNLREIFSVFLASLPRSRQCPSAFCASFSSFCGVLKILRWSRRHSKTRNRIC